jgi:F-type H+-transporting ATPase subunit alpha
MAQYRELEAFSQFSSDLDAETKRHLERGARATELIKQAQFAPMSLELQVATIYALNHGYFDSIPMNQVRDFEQKLHEYLSASKQDVLKAVSLGWDEDTERGLHDAVKEFVNIYGVTSKVN